MPAAAGGVGPSAAAVAGTRSIAVLDFANVTGDADVAWLSAGIAETVTNDLRAIRALRVIDRTLLPRGQAAGTDADAARASGLDLVVVGSFQRAGDQLRITARVIEVATLGALAQAKADGPLAEVFHLQDRLVIELSSGLQIGVTAAARERISARETASLDAYRALTEGRLKLETLDAAQVPAALADFERALALDPEYALAHVGLAHAHFWRFQASRARNTPDRDALVAAIAHARAPPSSIPISPKRTPRSRCCSRAPTDGGRRRGRPPGRGARARQLAPSVPARHRGVGRGAAAVARRGHRAVPATRLRVLSARRWCTSRAAIWPARARSCAPAQR